MNAQTGNCRLVISTDGLSHHCLNLDATLELTFWLWIVHTAALLKLVIWPNAYSAITFTVLLFSLFLFWPLCHCEHRKLRKTKLYKTKVDFATEKMGIFIIFSLHIKLHGNSYKCDDKCRIANQLRGIANQFQNCVAVTAHYCWSTLSACRQHWYWDTCQLELESCWQVTTVAGARLCHKIKVKTMDVCYCGFLYSTIRTFIVSVYSLKQCVTLRQKFCRAGTKTVGGLNPLAP